MPTSATSTLPSADDILGPKPAAASQPLPSAADILGPPVKPQQAKPTAADILGPRPPSMLDTLIGGGSEAIKTIFGATPDQIKAENDALPPKEKAAHQKEEDDAEFQAKVAKINRGALLPSPVTGFSLSGGFGLTADERRAGGILGYPAQKLMKFSKSTQLVNLPEGLSEEQRTALQKKTANGLLVSDPLDVEKLAANAVYQGLGKPLGEFALSGGGALSLVAPGAVGLAMTPGLLSTAVKEMPKTFNALANVENETDEEHAKELPKDATMAERLLHMVGSKYLPPEKDLPWDQKLEMAVGILGMLWGGAKGIEAVPGEIKSMIKEGNKAALEKLGKAAVKRAETPQQAQAAHESQMLLSEWIDKNAVGPVQDELNHAAVQSRIEGAFKENAPTEPPLREPGVPVEPPEPKITTRASIEERTQQAAEARAKQAEEAPKKKAKINEAFGASGGTLYGSTQGETADERLQSMVNMGSAASGHLINAAKGHPVVVAAMDAAQELGRTGPESHTEASEGKVADEKPKESRKTVPVDDEDAIEAAAAEQDAAGKGDVAKSNGVAEFNAKAAAADKEEAAKPGKTLLFASPNQAEGTTLADARSALRSKPQKQIISDAQSIAEKNGIKDVKVENAMGVWQKTAENSIRMEAHGDTPMESLRKTAAEVGLNHNQLAVAIWRDNADGEAVRHEIAFPKGVSADEASQLVADYGLDAHTLTGNKKSGIKVDVIDFDLSKDDNVVKLLNEHPEIQHSLVHGDSELVGGGDTREASAKIYRKILGIEEQPSTAGGGNAPVEGAPAHDTGTGKTVAEETPHGLPPVQEIPPGQSGTGGQAAPNPESPAEKI